MKKHLLLSHPCLLDHGISTHPENAGRLQAILTALTLSPYKSCLDLSMTRLATFDELAQVHTPNYVNYVLSLEGMQASLDYETHLTTESVKAARCAAGLGLELVEQILDNKIQNGFALVRPPGHHSRPDTAMGFCVFNNIALAAKKAISKGIKRILIFDWDVHHGNGTQEAFYEDDRVLFIDFHQDNLFPAGSGLISQKGKGKGLGFTVNVPFPDSCRDDDYLYAFENLVKPLATKYQPELILVSAGFDAHESDPLGSMGLTTKGYGMLTAEVKTLADTLCNGKVVFFLEGGYNPEFLAKNVLECISVLAADTDPLVKSREEIQPYTKGIEDLINGIYETHAG